MEIERLVKMANQIGEFFDSQNDRAEAVNAIAQHLKNFWEPRMRHQIIEYVKGGDGELRDVVRAAILKLESVQSPA
ncbi:MAG: formate dehydrogenase subunit delta [Candidatus Binataceae bacterium]